MSEEQQHHLALPQGTRIRDFEFHRVLGHGGFGITYLGWNVTLDIPVAIKEYLPTDLAARKSDQSVVPQSSQVVADFQWGLERFLDEARTLARLQHPNIVRVHQYFEAHGTAYIAMDYVEGEDLSAYLTRKGTLSEAELKGILYPLLSALEVIHGANFLHRDIKPGNIVLRDLDGSPVLLDFGAARQAIGAKSRSVTSIVTPGYAPIEQYSSRGRQGPWTDIYALGGVCYRALTGQVPDDATDRMRNDPLVPVLQRCADRVSGAFLSAVDAALSVDEEDRPPSVEAWREMLGAGEERVTGDAPDVREGVFLGVPMYAQVGQVTGDAPDVRGVDPVVPRESSDAAPSAIKEKAEGERKSARSRVFAIVVVVVALLVGGQMYVDHAEQVALEKQRQAQAAERARLAAEQAEKRRREQAALEKQRREQAALEKQRQEQAFITEVGRRPHPRGINNGKTDLHIAAELNLPVLTMSLLKQGADVHAKDKYGWTPLYRAARSNASATAKVLLNNGADVNARIKDGWTPLHRAARSNALATAKVLLNNGADVNVKAKDGWTPLHRAAMSNAWATAEVLLNNGADVNARIKYSRRTPLRVAEKNNASRTARVLRRHGGKR